MFGTEFNKIFDNKSGHPYSGFLDNTKRTRLFKEAAILAIEEKYRQLDEQKEYDELSSIIKTETTFTPSSNQIYIKGTDTPLIDDYEHLLTVKSKYTVSTLLTVTDASRETPIVITVSERNNLRNEQLTIAGITGNTNANGTHYVKKINSKQFALYSDKRLSTAIASNAQYLSGGSLSRIYYNYCKPYYSDRKIATYGKPSLAHPKFELASTKIKFYPTDETVQQITMDYITKATVFVDPADYDQVNLEDTYSTKFLYHILNVACRLYAERFRDQEMLQTSMLETQINP